MESKQTKLNNPLETLSVARKAVVIPGGTTGMGAAAAQLLVANGARVVVCGRHAEELNQTLSELRSDGGEAYGLTADITLTEDVARLFALADEKLGGVDILINCAAVPARSILEASPEECQYVVRANVVGTMLCAREAIARMRRRGSGHIVNLGSMANYVEDQGASLYVATKSAIHGLSASLRKEVNDLGIKVSLIEPGGVASAMLSETDEQKQEMQAEMTILSVEDIAACILYCLTQPARVDVIGVQIRARKQVI